MHKKCIICDGPAEFMIKDTNDYYCNTCAAEQFGDLSYLIKVEEQAKELKKLVDEKFKDESEEQEHDSNEDVVDEEE